MEDERLSLRKLAEQEYETQHFGFSSQTIIDVVRGVITDATKCAAETLAMKITEHMKGSKPEEVTAAADQLQKEYEAATKESLEMWQDKIEKHFCIPDHVLLEEDEAQRKQFSAAEATAVDDGIASLMHRAKRAALLDSFLGAQLETVRKMRQRLDECEARLGDEQAVCDLVGQVNELAECAQAFTSRTNTFGNTELKLALIKETNSITRSRFQHLK